MISEVKDSLYIQNSYELLLLKYFLIFYEFCMNSLDTTDTTILRYYLLRDIEILGWCPAGASLTSWGEGASLALVGHPSSDGITIKMPYGVDVLHRPASHPIFSFLGWLKLKHFRWCGYF